MKFTDLGLSAPILSVLDGEGYETPTPIQAQTIPVVLAGRDVLGIAQTGTGKTAAFALPILQRLAADKRPVARRACRALILSPTRELASQIGASFQTYGRGQGLSVAVVFGGVAHRPQIQTLERGIDILVATPGRLLDHVSERVVNLESAEILVLDEADQMLDLGFIKPIRRIVSYMSKKRQNLFFSATMPREIAGLADDLLVDPVKVAVTPVAKTADRVEQRVIHVETSKKRSLLVELFADPSLERTLVFTRTKRGADRVASHLEAAGIDALAIHGNKSQRQREEALAAFKAARVRVLVATDIAARGIDIDAVSHVVNFDLPEVPEAYVHRIGRTARAGAAGNAISLCDGEERDLLRAIERLTRQTIPAEDRRNDATLVAVKSPARSEERRERERQSGRDRGGEHRGRGERSGRPGPGGHRAGPNNRQGAARHPTADGIRDRAPRREAEDRRPMRSAGPHEHRRDDARDTGSERPAYTGTTDRNGSRDSHSERRSPARPFEARPRDDRAGDDRRPDDRRPDRASDGYRSRGDASRANGHRTEAARSGQSRPNGTHADSRGSDRSPRDGERRHEGSRSHGAPRHASAGRPADSRGPAGPRREAARPGRDDRRDDRRDGRPAR